MNTNVISPAVPEPWWSFGHLVLSLGFGFLLIMGALCLILQYKIWKNQINRSTLLDEADGTASMSRFQLLVFTLVFAVGFFLFMLRNPGLPDIPASVLTLLGISASTYAVGKGIQFSRPEGLIKSGSGGTSSNPPPDPPPPNPSPAPVPDGQQQPVV